MKIKKLKTLDFQGLRGQKEWTFDDITVLCQKNQSGKTSLLNAIIYGLTGVEPEGKIVNDNAAKAAVGILFEDGTDIIRMKTGGSTVCYLNNRKTTKKLLDKAVVNATGVPIEAMKVTTSEDVLKSIKPQDFGALILSYTDDQLDVDTIASFVSELTPEMRNELEKRLPEGLFGIGTVNAFYKQIHEDRLTQRKAILEKEGALKVLREFQAPDESKEQLQQEELKLNGLINEAKTYNEKLRIYNEAKKASEDLQKTIALREKQLEENKSVKRDIKERESISSDLSEKRKLLITARETLTSCNKVMADTAKVLENIDTSICPLSAKLVCTTDKTAVKDELRKILENAKVTSDKQLSLIKELETGIEKKEKELRDFDKEQEQYRLKEMIKQELETLKAQKIVIPDEPKKPEVENVAKELEIVKRKLHIWTNLEKATRIDAILEKGKKVLETFQKLEAAFAPKGEVMENITRKYMRAFEEECNKKAGTLKPGMKVKFVAENGVQTYIDTKGDDTYLPYTSLSGGEKALYLYIILDLLNTLSGLRVLILDELSVLDKETFESLIEIILKHREDYDQIFLSMVNHDDTIETLNDKGVAIKEI